MTLPEETGRNREYKLQPVATAPVALLYHHSQGRSKENAAQELVKEGVNGYTFSLQDSEEAIEKINRILSDVKLRESMEKESYRIFTVRS